MVLLLEHGPSWTTVLLSVTGAFWESWDVGSCGHKRPTPGEVSPAPGGMIPLDPHRWILLQLCVWLPNTLIRPERDPQAACVEVSRLEHECQEPSKQGAFWVQ